MPLEAVAWRADETVIDLGCGTGSSLRHLATLCPKGRLIGVEPTPAMLAIARHETRQAGLSGRIELRDGAAESIPVSDARADTVLAFSTWHHWQDTAAGLAEIRRVLKPQGRLLLSEEPEVLGWHNLSVEHLVQRIGTAGFSVTETRRLTEQDAECDLIVATRNG